MLWLLAALCACNFVCISGQSGRRYVLQDTQCVTRESEKSGVADDAETWVACQSDEQMTGCTAYTY